MKAEITGGSAREIAASIEHAIRRGALVPGEALPSVRELAGDLGVSPATASAAYRILRDRALIVTQQRRGVRVSERPALGGLRAPRELPAHVVDLASGNPDPHLLPSMKDGLQQITPRNRLYGEAGSVPELISVLSRGIEPLRGATSHGVIIAGGLDGIERVLQVHLRPGDAVAVEDPGYTGIRDLIRALGLICVPVTIDDEGPDPRQLERVLVSGVRALVVTPRAQNPTGATISEERATLLRRVLAGYPDVVVIEDDHVAEVSSAARHTIITEQRHWAVVRSINKSHGPDLRIGLVRGDEETVSRVEGRQSIGYGWVSTLLQDLALHLLNDPTAGETISRAAHEYRFRRETVLHALADRQISASGSSGFNIWVPVPEEDSVVYSLLEKGWAVRAGEPYRFSAPAGIRVTVSTLSSNDAERFADDLQAVLRPVRRLRLG